MPSHCTSRESAPSSNSPQLTPFPRSSRSSDERSSTNEPNSYELHKIKYPNQPGHEEAAREHDELLPSVHRSSIDSVQSFELYTPDEDQAVLKKLDRRLVAFMAFLYSLSFLDRSNIGNARIAGLVDDLNLSSNQYEWLLWSFYITYILFEWMTLMYQLIPPHIYISICVFSWGIIASFQAVSNSFFSLLVLRAFLGMSEAAFGPGVPFYLSFFFRRNELAFRIGLFVSASPLSASFAGALAYAITKLEQNGPLSPWRLLFLLEGFPSILVAVWAWNFVPDSPGKAKWLTIRQQEVAILRLRQEKEADEDSDNEIKRHGQKKAKINLREILKTLKDPKAYLIAFMFLSCNVAFSSMPVFLPMIVRDMGYHSIMAQGLTAPPYLVAFVVVLATAYYSDRLQSRSTFVMLHSLLAAFGYGVLAISGYYKSKNNILRYIALYPATAGFFSAITLIITWAINNQQTDSSKGTGVAMLNVIGQIGPLIGTSVFSEKNGPYFVKGMTISASFMLLVGVLALILRLVLIRSNKRLKADLRGEEHAGIPLTGRASAQSERQHFEYIL